VKLHDGMLAGYRLLMRQKRWSRFDLDPIGITICLAQCEAHGRVAADKYAPEETVTFLHHPAAAWIPMDRYFI
jgi:hypothetical protein